MAKTHNSKPVALALFALALGYERLSEQELISLHRKWNSISENLADEVIVEMQKIRATRSKPKHQRVLVRMFTDRLTWAVRVVEKGESYGLRNCLTYEKDEPLVEFYDTRFPHTNLGQFVSRYNLSTLVESHPYGQGLCLYGGVPDWTIYDECFGKIQDWLMSLELLPTKEVEHV